MRHSSILSLGLAAAAALSPSGAAADDYDDAFAAAGALDRAGRPGDAARALAAALPRYPQDYALPLQIAYRHYLAGRYQEAEWYYEEAIRRSPRALEAQLGLAFSLEKEGRAADAGAVFAWILGEDPENAEARAGRARCAPRPSWRTTLSLAGNGGYFPGDPYRRLSGGGTVSATFAHRGGFFVGGAYRYSHFAPNGASGLGAWDQHEAFANLGYSGAIGGLSLHYGFARDGSGALGDSHHLGLTARVSPFGDIEVRGALSFYDDGEVLRIEPSWRIPVAFGLSVRPGLAAEYALGEALVTGMLTLSLDRGPWSLWAGGKYGDELRPVYFAAPAIVNATQKIAYGGWAGASVNVSEGVRIQLSYALDRLKQADGSASYAHALSLGIAASF